MSSEVTVAPGLVVAFCYTVKEPSYNKRPNFWWQDLSGSGLYLWLILIHFGVVYRPPRRLRAEIQSLSFFYQWLFELFYSSSDEFELSIRGDFNFPRN